MLNKKVIQQIAKDGISKSLTNLIEDNNNKIDELLKLQIKRLHLN